ncbi:MerR family transcriptional regulator [Lentilactobacillus laojiaonis]|uniref:MerR family transcriptional regulator n=1 Tax=Lentilactobacillus laojiaonis TaxID=2883998 RepID=UPI001D0AFE9C|nr:MerR family transcriptional regulator [Lentilactobacillus laojiaonis]UDM32556.1 MerR family transcriptional regulator [Lentilactobacillus laojiaonis]
MQKTYSIKIIAEYFDLPISTIRYYDKQGLLPFVAKDANGRRIFTRADFGLIKTIICLKNTDMPLGDIKEYITLVMQGPKTIEQRRKLLQVQKNRVLEKQRILDINLKEIDRKIDRYSRDDAVEIIGADFRRAGQDKIENQLPNPFIV